VRVERAIVTFHFNNSYSKKKLTIIVGAETYILLTFAQITVELTFRVFWYIAPCNLVEVDRRFTDAYCLHYQGDEFIYLMMEAVRTYETSVNINVTTRRYIPEDSKLHIRRRENLKSHIL
jgi:hypothetical protein